MMKSMSNKRKRLGLTALGVVALAGAMSVLAVGSINQNIVLADANDAIAILDAQSEGFASVAKMVSPAVVHIRAEQTVERRRGMSTPPGIGSPHEIFGDDFLRRFFGPPLERNGRPQPPPQRRMGQGSGFIISENGYIITNSHVINEADELLVTLQDGQEYSAEIIGADPDSDVAVIKIDATDLPHVPLGDSDDVEVGQWVLAVGSPFGLSHSVTAGIVSAKGRTTTRITQYDDLIQTDAAINPGNSGGPLVNLRGEAIGLNTAILSRSGGYMGISFAIPSNMVSWVRDQLLDGGVTRGWLGVGLQALEPDLAESFGLGRDESGVLLSEVFTDTPAEKAGLQIADIVLELDGKPITDMGAFRNAVSMMKPNSTVRLTVLRDGRRKKINVTIGERDPDKVASVSPDAPNEELGFTVQELTDELADRLGYEDHNGVLVSRVEPASDAYKAGIRRGHLIQSVNGDPTSSVVRFRRAVQDAPDGRPVRFRVYDPRTQFARYVTLRIH
jgi:serine protease Do